MKKTIGMVFLILAALTIAAIFLIPEKREDGKIPLVWVSASVPAREDQVKKFNEMHPKYNLSIDPGNTGMTKIIVQCSANMGGDIIDFVSEQNIQTYHDAGILMDLTEHAEKMGFGLDTLPDSVKPLVVVKELGKDGKIVVRQYTYPMNIFHTYIIYNKNIFDKYNVPYPPKDLTWEEYIKLAKKLTIYDNDSKVPRIFGGMGVHYTTILWEKGGRIMNNDGTRCELDSKAAIDSMIFYHDLYFKEKVEPAPATKAGIVTGGSGNTSNYNMLGTGKLAMAWGARWYLMMLRQYVDQQRAQKARWLKENPGKEYTGIEPLRYGACHVPRFKNGKRFTTAGGRTVGINAKGKYKEHALAFMKHAAGPEYNLSMCEIADCKPPNKKYYSVDKFYSKKYPEEKEVHDLSIEAVKFGKVPLRSPFINNSVVNRILNKALSKIRAEDDLTDEEIANICRRAADQVNNKIRLNIERNPKLKKLYKKMVAQGAEPVLDDKRK